MYIYIHAHTNIHTDIHTYRVEASKKCIKRGPGGEELVEGGGGGEPQIERLRHRWDHAESVLNAHEKQQRRSQDAGNGVVAGQRQCICRRPFQEMGVSHVAGKIVCRGCSFLHHTGIFGERTGAGGEVAVRRTCRFRFSIRRRTKAGGGGGGGGSVHRWCWRWCYCSSSRR